MPTMITRGAASARGFGLFGGASGLYPFTTFTFTNAGITGRFGPSYGDCVSAYGSQPFITGGFFSVNVQGIQSIIVPKTGNYQFQAVGAKGGDDGTTGGVGVVAVASSVPLVAGQTIFIVCGQMGNNSGGSGGGGGGGGSFVYTGSNNGTVYSLSDCIVAGGGGSGANNGSPVQNAYGEPAQTGVLGGYGYNNYTNAYNNNSSSRPQTAGYGGKINNISADGNNYGGGAGAGFMEYGESSPIWSTAGSGGGWGGNSGRSYGTSQPVNTGFNNYTSSDPWAGGRGGIGSSTNRAGGFGGGAGAADDCGGSGAGGGYSGGMSQGCYCVNGSGASGGVYFSGTNGTNSGHGYVVMTAL